MSRSRKKISRPTSRPRHGFARALVVCVAIVMIGLVVFRAVRRRHSPTSQTGNNKAVVAQPAGPALEDERTVFAQYGGSESCRECHKEEYDLWKQSHHALAERPVQPATDRPAFDPVRSFKHGTQTTDLQWSNGVAEVTGIGLSGKPEMHAVARVIGNNPLRQFLVPFPGGRFQTLEASYDPHANEWFDVYGNEDRQPGEWGHWTGRGMNWNFMCASCHNTRLRRNYDESTDSYHTTMAEISVGCEACHGPMKAHNDWQKKSGKSGQSDPTLTKSTREQVLDTCGACHARRTDLTGDFKPGDHFGDHFDLETVGLSDRYYADGQVRDEDYEYGSFLGSRMHLRGVHCLDCHNPHSYKTILPGNWLCLRCHDGSNKAAPTINPVTHSHHQVYGSDTNGHLINADLKTFDPRQIKQTGGECVNCHMPQTVYMQRHSRHDHGFTIPDPLLTKQFGIPNACNRCHQGKDPDWALKYTQDWYGSKMDRPSRQRAQLIAQARQGNPQSRDGLLALLKTEESPYWQAVALGLLSDWASQLEVTTELVKNLDHTNDLVRAAAARALETALATQPDVAIALRARLADPERNVRIAAAWSLRSVVDPGSPAGRELHRFLENNADEPIGQMQLGIYAYSRNDLPSALSHFQKAVAWDPYSVVFHQELAVILSQLNRPQEAVQTLEEACRLVPRDAESHYQLGLAYNEAGDLQRATDQLARTVQLNPRHTLAWYNLGLAQYALGQPDTAMESLLRAETVAPDDARIPYARATILAHLGRTREATAATRRALEINPSYPEARQLLQALGK